MFLQDMSKINGKNILPHYHIRGLNFMECVKHSTHYPITEVQLILYMTSRVNKLRETSHRQYK